MKSLAIIVPYFGKWPRWMPFFVESAACNPTFTWILVSDIGVPSNLPNNFRYYSMSPRDVADRLKATLNIEAQIANGFKLCDYRPAFGVLFQDILKEYDYWAWGDLDVIYGDLRSFIGPFLESDYDVVTMGHSYTAGVMTAIRNRDTTNRLFQLSPDWRRVFTAADNYNFVEFNFFYPKKNVYSFTHIVNALIAKNEIRAAYTGFEVSDRSMRKSRVNLLWQKGRLRDVDAWRDIAIYHFLDMKKRPSFTIKALHGRIACFSLSGEGIEQKNDDFRPTFSSARFVYRSVLSLARKAKCFIDTRTKTDKPTEIMFD